jgi:hypothetical protein
VTIGQKKMPRASALAPQAVSVVRSYENKTNLFQFSIDNKNNEATKIAHII